MIRLPRYVWLGVFAGLIVLGGGFAAVLAWQEASLAARVVSLITLVLVQAWAGYGFYLVRDRQWARWLAAWVVASDLVMLITWGLIANEHVQGAYAIGGIYWMASAFFLGMWGLRALCIPGLGFVGVARTVLDEAIRMRLGVVFAVLLVLVIPVLPLLFDDEKRLTYRVQSFLTYSLIGTNLIVGLLTVLLACWTITREVEKKQVFLTLTKPIGRFEYLVGKWLGVMLVSLLLLSTSGVATWTFARVMAQGKALNDLDARAVTEEVLVARATVRPQPPADMDTNERFKQRLVELQRQHPDFYGEVGSSVDPSVAQEVWGSLIAEWHTLHPLEVAGGADGQPVRLIATTQFYVFKGLQNAAAYGNEDVQLRIKPKASKTVDGNVRFRMRINGREKALPPFAVDTFHVIPLDVKRIDENGELNIAMSNLDPRDARLTVPVDITFPPGEGLELFYNAGTFEGNLTKSYFISLLCMGFLAMLGLAAGTFMTFPVAALFTFTISTLSIASAYINESLQYFASLGPKDASGWAKITAVFDKFGETFGDGKILDGFKIILRLAGEMFMLIVPSFGRFSNVTFVAEGRLIPTSMVLDAVWWVGVVWTGIALLVAWLIWRKRELAKITV